MILFGAGGHMKVVCSCLEDNDIQVLGVFDNNYNLNEFGGINVLGKYDKEKLPNKKIIISIGDNALERKYLIRLNINLVMLFILPQQSISLQNFEKDL